jgi:hypothetical protein
MALRVERLRINTRDSPFRIRMLTPRAAAWKRRQTARLLEDFNGAVRRDHLATGPAQLVSLYGSKRLNSFFTTS